MKLPKLRMPPLANDSAVLNHDGTNQGIRADPPPPALSKLKRSAQMLAIRACDLRVHSTD